MLNTLKIAIVAACPFPYGRGTPLRIQHLAKALSDIGHEVHILTYPIGNETKLGGVTVTRVKNLFGYKKFDSGPSLQKPLLDLLLIAQVRKFIKSNEVDVIYAHHFEGAMAALLARVGMKVPVIYDAHTTLTGELGTYGKFFNSKPVKALSKLLDRLIPRKVDHVISVSDEIAEFLVSEGIQQDKISVIPDGTEVDTFAKGSAERAKSKFKINSKPTLIYTGNLATFQGVNTLLDAVPEVLATVPDAQLIIAGSGESAAYESKVAEMNLQHAIRFIYQPEFGDVVDLLALSNVAVLPRSVCPGIPLKLLNYMAAGKAIVAFEGSAKVLQHLDSGYIAENGNPNALANGIIECLTNENLQNRLGDQARHMVIQKFTWESMADKATEVFANVSKADLVKLELAS